MFKVTLELPNEIKTSLGKDSGLWTKVPLEAIPLGVLKMALENGFISALNDISRGKDEDGRALSDEAWAKKREARVKAWLGGSWASTERSESAMSLVKEQWIAERVSEGMTVKAAEKAVKDLVSATFGEKEPATFARFLDAVATHLEKDGEAGSFESIREEIERDLRERAELAAAERSKAAKKVDVKGIALAAFKRK